MSLQDTKVRTDAFVFTYLVEILTVVCLLFVVTMGLIPFDFFSSSAGPATGAPFAESQVDHTLPNISANIAFFAPLGLLLHWSLVRRRFVRFLAFSGAIILGSALSIVLEWLQAYSPSRVSSIVDVAFNTLGTGVGAFLSWSGRSLGPRALNAAIRSLDDRPRIAIAKAYCLLLVIFATLPFTFAISGNRIKEAIKSASVTPFERVIEFDTSARDALGRGDVDGFALAKYMQHRQVSALVIEGVSFGLLVWLLYPALRLDFGFGELTSMALIAWICLLMAVTLSLLQLPIVLRGFHITDVLARVAGAGVGLFARFFFSTQVRIMRPEHWRQLSASCLLLTIVYIFYTGLVPFIALPAGRSPFESLDVPSFLPLYAYFNVRFHVMAQDFAQKLVSFTLLGALVVSASERLSALPLKRRFWRAAMVGCCVSLTLEIAQMFLRVRVTSLTDLIIAGVSCGVGVIVKEHAGALYRFATEPEIEETESSPPSESQLGPMDELLGTLAEEHPDAPTERVPKRAPQQQQ